MYEISFLERFQLLAVVSLPQCAFAHFGAGVKASIIFVRKRGNDEVANNEEAIFMAAPELIGYDATGRKPSRNWMRLLSNIKSFWRILPLFRLTPGANELCAFAVKRGDISQRLILTTIYQNILSWIKKLHTIFGKKLMHLGELADVICGPFGSAITNKDYQESGIPLIRITNISGDGYMDYSDIIYISEELGNSLSRTQVSAGDIVISQRGSLGQCAIVDDTFPKLNISANIIAIKNPKGNLG